MGRTAGHLLELPDTEEGRPGRHVEVARDDEVRFVEFVGVVRPDLDLQRAVFDGDLLCGDAGFGRWHERAEVVQLHRLRDDVFERDIRLIRRRERHRERAVAVAPSGRLLDVELEDGGEVVGHRAFRLVVAIIGIAVVDRPVDGEGIEVPVDDGLVQRVAGPEADTRQGGVTVLVGECDVLLGWVVAEGPGRGNRGDTGTEVGKADVDNVPPVFAHDVEDVQCPPVLLRDRAIDRRHGQFQLVVGCQQRDEDFVGDRSGVADALVVVVRDGFEFREVDAVVAPCEHVDHAVSVVGRRRPVGGNADHALACILRLVVLERGVPVEAERRVVGVRRGFHIQFTQDGTTAPGRTHRELADWRAVAREGDLALEAALELFLVGAVPSRQDGDDRLRLPRERTDGPGVGEVVDRQDVLP